jgi:hypothetical protein
MKMMADKTLARRYLELLKSSLLNELYIENEAKILQALHKISNEKLLTCDDFYDPQKLLVNLLIHEPLIEIDEQSVFWRKS